MTEEEWILSRLSDNGPQAQDLGADLETAQGQHQALTEILETLTEILDGIRRSPMNCLPDKSDTAVLGVLLASYLNYLGSDILAVAEHALLSSGLYGSAHVIGAYRQEIERTGYAP